MERYPVECKQVFTNYISDKNLVYRMRKELLELNNKYTNNPIQEWANDLGSHFSKEDIRLDERHMERSSMLLKVISEM